LSRRRELKKLEKEYGAAANTVRLVGMGAHERGVIIRGNGGAAIAPGTRKLRESARTG